MALEKQTKVDLIEVVHNNVVQVRSVIEIIENGEVISSSFHRHVVNPGQDYSNEDVRVQLICQAVHTPEAIEAFLATQKPPSL